MKDEKVLILTEKASISNKIREALSGADYDITVAEIGGHIHLDEESDVLHVSKEELDKAVCITVDDGTKAYVLDDETIKKNAEKIKSLAPENFNFILNACDPDDSGQLLFDYAASLVDFDPRPCARMIIKDLTAESIAESFDVAVNIARVSELIVFLDDAKRCISSDDARLIVIRWSEEMPNWCIFACSNVEGTDVTNIRTALYYDHPFCQILHKTDTSLVLSLLASAGIRVEIHSEYFD